ARRHYCAASLDSDFASPLTTESSRGSDYPCFIFLLGDHRPSHFEPARRDHGCFFVGRNTFRAPRFFTQQSGRSRNLDSRVRQSATVRLRFSTFVRGGRRDSDFAGPDFSLSAALDRHRSLSSAKLDQPKSERSRSRLSSTGQRTGSLGGGLARVTLI